MTAEVKVPKPECTTSRVQFFSEQTLFDDDSSSFQFLDANPVVDLCSQLKSQQRSPHWNSMFATCFSHSFMFTSQIFIILLDLSMPTSGQRNLLECSPATTRLRLKFPHGIFQGHGLPATAELHVAMEVLQTIPCDTWDGRESSTFLVGGWPTPLKNMSQLGWDYPIYEMENKSNVWNHQPDFIWISFLGLVLMI